MYSKWTPQQKIFKQIRQVEIIINTSKAFYHTTEIGDTRTRITCMGTQPSRDSGKDHEECGKEIDLLFAYKCLYCGFYFCRKCAEKHFGKTIEEFKAEQDLPNEVLP